MHSQPNRAGAAFVFFIVEAFSSIFRRADRVRADWFPRTFVTAVCFGVAACGAAEPTVPAADPPILTNITQIWSITGEAVREPHRIRTEFVLYYFDSDWNCAWGESYGIPTFIPVSDSPIPLKSGQRVAIDGYVIPSREAFIWENSTVRVLEEDVRMPAREVADLSQQIDQIGGRRVVVNLVVEGTNSIPPWHIQIRTHSGTLPGTVHVLMRIDELPPPCKQGDYVRVEGVFIPKSNRQGRVTDFDLWVAKRSDLQVIGSLEEDPRFAIPRTLIERIGSELPAQSLIRIDGVVRAHEPGKTVTIWDETGQAIIESLQMQPLEPGDRVSAIGLPLVMGIQNRLREATYRVVGRAGTNATSAAGLPIPVPIRLAGRVQLLSEAEAALRPAVRLRGVLMWAHAETSFVYVHDGSGGVRIQNPSWEGSPVLPGAIVTVRGEAVPGGYVPVVTNAVMARDGWRGFDPPQPVTLEQALVGGSDGQWVQMRGFVRNAVKHGGLARLELSTSEGDFQAWTPASPAADSLAGTVVRVDGVCSATANNRRQLTGIELWVPDPLFIRIDEPETRNVFASELRPLGGLRQFGSNNELNRRVKTSGTVVLHRPGRYLYLQDGQDSVFALSRQEEVLKPGDRVELAGFPGTEHGRFLLREAIFRRLSSGTEPEPVPITATNTVQWELGGRVARAAGILLNTLEKEERVQLLLRSGGAVFEAAMDEIGKDAAKFRSLPMGSRLSLTGVYEVQSDEYGRPGSFLLLLRSWDDVKVLAEPPWWTTARLRALLIAATVVLGVSLLWGMQAARRNSQLRRTQAELQNVNKELESFSYSVSHDLRAPLRSIEGFSRALLEDYEEKLDDEGRENLQTVRAASQRMDRLIDDMLRLSRINRTEMRCTEVNLSHMAEKIAASLQASEPDRKAEFTIAPDCVVHGDSALLHIALENVLGNAWKYTSQKPEARIEFGTSQTEHGTACFVRDNGCGFDMAYVHKLFGAFQRLHTESQFPGTGIGLASVRRVIQRHGGRVWIEGKVGEGATVYFTLPKRPHSG